MFFYEGFSCPVCGQVFQETDDIVACPQCGAPHHRACWQAVGHCALQEDHGTPQQWSRDTAKKVQSAPAEPTNTADDDGERYAWTCPACGTHNLEYAEFCTKCGRQRASAPEWHSAEPAAQTPFNGYREYTPFPTAYPMADPYGGVGRNEMLDEEVSATDAVTFTAVNSHYYLPRFRNIARGNKFSWNWAAFLMHPYWLLYRKSFIAGFILLGLSMIQGVMRYQMLVRIEDIIGAGLTQVEMIQRLQLLFQENETLRYLVIGVALLRLLEVIVAVLMGICGNWIYQKTAFAKIKKAKAQQPESYPTVLQRTGGVSFASGMLAYLFSNYLITFLYMLIK